MPQPRPDLQPFRPRTAERSPPHQRHDRHGQRDRRVHTETPRERDDAVLVGERGEHDQPGDPAEREARRRGAVAVERGERAGGERREQLHERGRHEHDERARRNVRRHRRQLPRQEVAELRREQRHEQGHRNRERQDRDPERAGLAAERAELPRPRQVRHDDHPERLRREDEDDVDRVRAEEAVGLRRAAELVREQRSCAGRGDRDDDLGEPGEEAAADGAPALRGAGGFHAPDQSRHSRTLTVP